MALSKIALVTGGTRGIGAAICKTLQRKGYRVLANYYKDQDCADLFEKQTHIPVYAWDVTNAKACCDALHQLEEEHGPIDILVNNAGICDDARVCDMTDHQWHNVINTNLNAVFYMCRAVIPSMCKKEGGRLIIIGSINGSRSAKNIGNYSASKSGVIGLVKAMAHELASYGITANVVSPGYIRTGLAEQLPHALLERIIKNIPLKRLGLPEEVAELVAFLASSSAAFITGSTLHINGGQWMA